MTTSRRGFVSLLVISALLLNGCATLFRGAFQTVTVLTDPPGGTVLYQGQTVRHGQTIIVQKESSEPRINIGDPDRPVFVRMAYGADPWLIGDGGLLLLALVPGIVGFGVDFGTGSWRQLDDPQIVRLAQEPSPVTGSR